MSAGDDADPGEVDKPQVEEASAPPLESDLDPREAASQEAMARVERLAAALILFVAVLAWGLQLVPQAPEITAASLDAGDLITRWDAGELRGLATLLGIVGLLSLGAFGALVVRFTRAGLPSAPPRGSKKLGVALGLMVLCYGVSMVVGVVVISGGKQGSATALTWGETTRKLSLTERLRLELAPDGSIQVEAVARDADAAGLAPVVAKAATVGASLQVSEDATLTLRLGEKEVKAGQVARVYPGDTVRLVRGETSGEVTLTGPGWPEVLPLLAIGSGLGLIAVILLLVLWSRRNGKGTSSSLDSLGFHLRGWRHEALRGGVSWLAVLPIYCVALGLTQLASNALGIEAKHHPLIQAMVQSPGLALWVVLAAAVVAPILEELLFRGLILTGFQDAGMGALAAVLAQAFVFSSVHPGFSHLLPILVLGVFFAALRVTSPNRSLVSSTVAHMLHNGFTILLAVLLLQGAG